ncbi:DUF4129 domain-containing protein [Cellulomonas marina]|uniref:Protein-glutamine gamma-glutamyltransferase-like C-terminal domain-containing protein n=1 Tax=Cellulomonas marina TaxID=988821 RepID=A0A1I0W5N5_9CELL|nr:DUF4129 domain-containing protein [Cellulomonas marina]GIG29998.1 hypothetical protein Cma02nite_25980 [Cellulomonas marina]SFA83657.1 protein of unknown function [Cellulomonas marina]
MPPDRREARRAAVVALTLVAAGVLVVVGAAAGADWTTGPARLDAFAPIAPPPAPLPTPVAVPGAESGAPTAGDAPSGALRVAAVLALAVLAVLVARWVVRVVRRQARERGQTGTAADGDLAPGDAGAGGDTLVPDLPALHRAATAALARLDAPGAGGDDVVAAWLAVERAAAESGVPRAVTWTSSELTAAVLAATDAEPDAVRTLLRLYQRARYGVGPAARLDADEVALARACLVTLARDWRVRA